MKKIFLLNISLMITLTSFSGFANEATDDVMEFVVKNDIINFKNSGTQIVTRLEYTTAIYKTLKHIEQTTGKDLKIAKINLNKERLRMPDADPETYSLIQSAALEYKVISLVTGKFRGDTVIQRFDASSLLYSYLVQFDQNKQCQPVKSRTLLETSKDVKPGSWIYPGIKKIVNDYQLMDLDKHNNFNPKGNLTKKDLAIIVYRLTKYIKSCKKN